MGVAVGNADGVAVPAGEAVGVDVGATVPAGVAVGVDVGATVPAGVAVGVAVGPAVGVAVGIAVGVGVGVAVGVGVGGTASRSTTKSSITISNTPPLPLMKSVWITVRFVTVSSQVITPAVPAHHAPPRGSNAKRASSVSKSYSRHAL